MSPKLPKMRKRLFRETAATCLNVANGPRSERSQR